MKTETAPTLSDPVTFATDASAGDVAHFFSDIFGYDMELDGGDRLPQSEGDPIRERHVLFRFTRYFRCRYTGLPVRPVRDAD